MSKEYKKIIIVQESVTKSIVKDTYTFGSVAATLYFNHRYLAGNMLIDLILLVLVLIVTAGRGSNQFFEGTRQEAIKHLEENR